MPALMLRPLTTFKSFRSRVRLSLALRRHKLTRSRTGFKSKLWPFTVAAAITSFIVYRVSARHALEPTAPLEKTEEEGLPAEYEDETKPFLTRYLAYHFPDKRKREQRADEHLRSVLQIKEDKLLVQAAEKQRLRTRRFPQCVVRFVTTLGRLRLFTV